MIVTVVVKKKAEECTPVELALGAALQHHRIHSAMRKAHGDENPASERALGAALALEAFAEKLEEFDAARSGRK